MTSRLLRRALAAAAVLLVALPAAASAADLSDPAAQWLPSSDGATWTYQWSNSTYSPTPRQELVRLTARDGTAFRLGWQEINLGPGDSAAYGSMDFKDSDAGLLNPNTQMTAPPAQFPVLCETAGQCGNSVAGTLPLLTWGTRSPVLSQPLLSGTTWNAVGGVNNDVVSTNHYVGRATVSVPAFPNGVRAARVDSDVTQAGALGDPFGSGLRSVYWVYGVGPVKIVFRHAGGETSEADLLSTNLVPLPMPPDANLLPLKPGSSARFRWHNDRHAKAWSTQVLKVSKVVNNTARVDARSISGPVRGTATYTFASRLSGLTTLAADTNARSRSPLPALGPAAGLEGPRHFYTPYDLMTYGFNPVIAAYAVKGDSWRSSRTTRDWALYGVTGVTRVLGRAKAAVPGRTYRNAIAVRSTLRQAGHPFGSGTRTSYFVPGLGLVRLVFKHADGSTTTVERVR
jgi:opacity protein-like surface antigen